MARFRISMKVKDLAFNDCWSRLSEINRILELNP